MGLVKVISCTLEWLWKAAVHTSLFEGEDWRLFGGLLYLIAALCNFGQAFRSSMYPRCHPRGRRATVEISAHVQLIRLESSHPRIFSGLAWATVFFVMAIFMFTLVIVFRHCRPSGELKC